MPKHFCKVARANEQLRISLPKALVKTLGWEDIAFAILEKTESGDMLVRRFVDRTSLETVSKENPGNLN